MWFDIIFPEQPNQNFTAVIKADLDGSIAVILREYGYNRAVVDYDNGKIILYKTK